MVPRNTTAVRTIRCLELNVYALLLVYVTCMHLLNYSSTYIYVCLWMYFCAFFFRVFDHISSYAHFSLKRAGNI